MYIVKAVFSRSVLSVVGVCSFLVSCWYGISLFGYDPLVVFPYVFILLLFLLSLLFLPFMIYTLGDFLVESLFKWLLRDGRRSRMLEMLESLLETVVGKVLIGILAPPLFLLAMVILTFTGVALVFYPLEIIMHGF